MIRKLGPLALLLMLVAVFAVGCGDDDKSDSSNDAPAVTTAAADDTATEEDTSSDDGDVADNPQVQQAVEQCKASIESNPAVKDDIKGDLQDICDKAASGDPEDVKAAIKEVCEKIVDSSVPEGDIRDQAKQACATAGG
jgi:hypothetical protein